MNTAPLNRTSSAERLKLAALATALSALVISIIPALSTSTVLPNTAHRIEMPVALPAPVTSSSAPSMSTADSWDTVTVRSGQTLGSIFQARGLPAATMQRLVDAAKADGNLARLNAGDELAFKIADNGQLLGFAFEKTAGKRVELLAKGESFKRKVIESPTERRLMLAGGTITSSLYAAGAKAGLGPAAINEMAKALQYDIDFAQDLRKGDRFQILHEEIWRDGERIGNGGVVAVSFVNQGKTYTALKFEEDGKPQFFDQTGRPLRKSFMRTPIEYARLTSSFGLRRHPILGRMKMHKGVDYGAGTGTPIMAAGDARVKFAGWQNGYGRVVILDHGQNITTLYAHMSRFGKYRVGQRVAQGAVIGYVGASGLASGPHLHYEFRVSGQHRNPLTVTMPKPEPLRGTALARFRAQTAPALAQLRRVNGLQLAAARTPRG